jgi:hypothetical protein
LSNSCRGANRAGHRRTLPVRAVSRTLTRSAARRGRWRAWRRRARRGGAS